MRSHYFGSGIASNASVYGHSSKTEIIYPIFLCVCVFENETVQGMNIPDNVTILILYGNNLLLQK